MPDFIAALAAAALFCGAMPVLNGLTRLVLHLHWAPADLGENGFLQYGLALALAGLLWRRTTRRPA